MSLKNLIQSNRFVMEILSAVLLGLWASLGIVRGLMWEEPRAAQVILFAAFAAIIALTYFKFIFRRFKDGWNPENKKKLIISVLISSLLAWLLVSFCDLPLPLNKGISQRLEIIPLAEEAQSIDIALLEVKIDGKKIPLGKFATGNGWKIQDGMLVYTGMGQDGVIYMFKNRPQSQMSLLFREGSQMGGVSIVINGKEMKRINLFGGATGDALVTVQFRGIFGPYWLVILLKTIFGIALLPATFIPSLSVWILLAMLRNSHPHPHPTEKVNPSWQFLLQMEFLLAGMILCWNSLFTVKVSTNYSIALESIFDPLLLAAGILLLVIGIIVLPTPKISGGLWNQKIIAYLIPAHFWVFLAVLTMELIVRLTAYSPPFTFVYTNWFGRVRTKGSFLIRGTEGYAITHFDGPPGEIHTPFQGGDNIVLLGDSFMEGLQVPDDQKFVSIAETALRQDGYFVDLHNMGDSGDAMADYVNRIHGYQQLYRPIIIVVELSENDFIESFNESKTSYFIAEGSNIVGIFNQNNIKDNYIVANAISFNFTSMIEEYGKMRLKQMTGQLPPQTSDNSIPKTFDINLAEQQMDLLLKACNGTPLIIVTIPHAPHISGDNVVITDPKHETLKVFLSNYPQLAVVDPLPEFQKLAYTGVLPAGFPNSPAPGSGHLNRRGNEILGILLAEEIKEVLK